MPKLKKCFITKDESSRLHNCQKPIIGLTGGISTGKSTVSKMLKKRGFFIIDADELVHTIYDEKETLEFIKNLCPQAIKNNELDFLELRKLAFEKKDLLKQLEDYIYKRMPAAFEALINESRAEVIIYDVPLLYEKKIDTKVDLSVVVYAEVSQQIDRAVKRDHSSTDLISQIIAKQLPIEDKRQRADFVIENTLDLDSLEQQVEDFVLKYFS